MAELAPLEIRALAKIMDELDYYQILHLERDASASSVKQAYYATSRTFHPDANSHLETELLDDCSRISKRVTEAYSVLRDPRRRKSYDQRLQNDEGLRIPLAAFEAPLPEPGTRWRMNLYRCDRANEAFLSWRAVLTRTFHTPERFGILQFD